MTSLDVRQEASRAGKSGSSSPCRRMKLRGCSLASDNADPTPLFHPVRLLNSDPHQFKPLRFGALSPTDSSLLSMADLTRYSSSSLVILGSPPLVDLMEINEQGTGLEKTNLGNPGLASVQGSSAHLGDGRFAEAGYG